MTRNKAIAASALVGAAVGTGTLISIEHFLKRPPESPYHKAMRKEKRTAESLLVQP